MLSAANTTKDQPQETSTPPGLSVDLKHDRSASRHCSLKVQHANARRCDTDDSNDSGDSSSGQQWFDKSNKHGHILGQNYIDNDSPFFLPQNSSGSECSQKAPAITPNKFPYGGRRPVTMTSSTDEYRSVIDDLTIENKKLKERLRKYERIYDAHLERDKLFEVKLHGLPPRKRRELEELLHIFVSSVHESSSSQDLGGDVREAFARKHRDNDGSSYSTSNSRALDSAYASMLISVPTSTSTTGQSDMEKIRAKAPMKAKDQHVESFLQDIPQGLLPKHSLVMTERSKKKMVVRKLEQLFIGTTSRRGTDYSQPIQQQEVSNSAARADHQDIENKGQPVQAEGAREAHILPRELESEKQHDTSRFLSNRQRTDSSTDESPHTHSLPDQRPTRPLDLDPDRAQVPQDNIEYIRHLGLSTLRLITRDSMDAELNEKGWVYLNLLISMAQLHIINVTPDFVRSAIQDLSTKFQLSHDGQKVRWRGGIDGTKLSSESGANSNRNGSLSNSDRFEQHTTKRRKVGSSPRQQLTYDQKSMQSKFSSTSICMGNRPATRSTTEAWVPGPNHIAQSRFAYRPLFNHHNSSPSEDLSCEEDNVSRITYTSDGGTTSGSKWGSRSRSATPSRKRKNEGAIIYYSGAPFCTDLSGDHGKINTPVHVEAVGRDGYRNHIRDAVGCGASQMPRAAGMNRTTSGSRILFRPFKDYSKGVELEWDHPKTPEPIGDDCDIDIEFSPGWSNKEESTQNMTDMIVSGLGAIRPADHFNVHVETRRTVLDHPMRKQLSKFSAPGSKVNRFLHRVSTNLGAIFEPECPDTDAKPVKTEIISEKKRELPPSSLPPPATLISFFSSSEEEEDSSTYSGIEHLSKRTPFISGSEPPIKSPSDIEMDLGNLEDNDGESIDMLAHLRAVDQNTIAAQEREYAKDRGLTTKRFDEDILAGSSAATVDGGSGFSSNRESNNGSDL